MKSWDNWLDEYYSSYLEFVKNRVKELCDQDKQQYTQLPFYTPHGISHFKAVEDMIHHLIPENRSEAFTIQERFYLLVSAWVHDLGMLTSTVSQVYPEKALAYSEIRNRHHLISEKFVVDHWAALGLNEQDKEPISRLCRFHSRKASIEECEEYILVGLERVKLKVLAAYLRLADALDVGSSRAPMEAYVVCLTYGIPLDIKLHWIKSRIVSGIQPNAENRNIIVQFKKPVLNGDTDSSDTEPLRKKLLSVSNLVLEDLRSELQSVSHVLTKYGPCPYLDISRTDSSIILDTQTLDDLKELVVNYDIMMNPSASKLLEMIIVSIGNILGVELHKSKVSKNIISEKPDEEVLNKLNGFLESLQNGPIQARPCHLGLKVIVDNFRKMINEKRKKEEFVRSISDCYRKHQSIRSQIRTNAQHFMEANYPGLLDKYCLNILLYGYSELVTVALCGFRDSFLKNNGIKDPQGVYNSKIEKETSKIINIYVCEGQPKTQTATGDHYVYHDGSQYALHLHRRNFSNIILIPDIIAGYIIAHHNIDFVMVGANGISSNSFWHSAGHCAIVNLVREFRRNRPVDKPNTKVILVASSEKYRPGKAQGDFAPENISVEGTENWIENSIHIVDGCEFLKVADIAVRETNWMLKDSKLLERIIESGAVFYNPLEDNIPIHNIDYMISNIGYDEINEENWKYLIDEHFAEKANIKI
ncbi:hypothetical protein TRIP_C20770 [Candidatus Zixiibacteriota bacterium]|nr:hypothetical protein TRIP_C20770 [candidate division Zixibacteria bacterium]